MPMSHYPNGFKDGISIRGVPLAVTHPGEVFWVNSTAVLPEGGVAGADSPASGTYQRPFATIDYAVGRCTANRGDVIMVMPGHSEDIDAASALDMDVAGVAVIGLGSGSDRPDLNFSDTAGTVDMAAVNTSLVNVTLTADVSAVVVGVNIDASYVTLENVEFNYNATGDDFITMIDADTVTGFSLLNSRLIAEDTAGCAEAVRLDTAHETTMIGNYIYGDFTDGAIIGEGAASTNVLIKDNVVYNSDTTAGFLVDLNVACTGIMTNNSFGTLFATAPETAVDPGSLLSNENYVCNAVDESGALVPITVST